MKNLLTLVFASLSVAAFGQAPSRPIETIKPISTVVAPAPPSLNQKPKATASPVRLMIHPSIRYALTDTTVEVISKLHQPQPACYVNGKFVGMTGMMSINPNQIDVLEVKKTPEKGILISKDRYYSQVFITLKQGAKPAFVSLADLVAKYTTYAGKPLLILVDDQVVTADYQTSMIDEKRVFRIMAESAIPHNSQTPLTLIHIRLRTQKNLNEANTIRIRGGSLSASR